MTIKQLSRRLHRSCCSCRCSGRSSVGDRQQCLRLRW